MRRLFMVGAVLGLAYGLRCYIRGQHKPARVFLGLRCQDCQAALADYDDAYGPGAGYALPTRKVFSRVNEETSRTSHWEPTARGH